MESVRPSCQKLHFPVHRNGRGQTGRFRSPNIFWPALENFVLPFTIIYNISQNEACRRICRPINKVRALTKITNFSVMYNTNNLPHYQDYEREPPSESLRRVHEDWREKLRLRSVMLNFITWTVELMTQNYNSTWKLATLIQSKLKYWTMLKRGEYNINC